MLAAADKKGLPSQKINWGHFDGSSGEAYIAERQYIEGTYTFGVSNKCRLTMEFTGFRVDGYNNNSGDSSVEGNSSVQWMQIYSDIGGLAFNFSCGSGNFALEEVDRPTSAMHYSHQVAPSVVFPIYTGSISEFPNLEAELFVLTVDLDRTTTHPNLAVDLRSANIVLIDAASYIGVQQGDIQTPATFTFRCGARQIERYWNESVVSSERGPINFTVTKFCCLDVA